MLDITMIQNATTSELIGISGNIPPDEFAYRVLKTDGTEDMFPSFLQRQVSEEIVFRMKVMVNLQIRNHRQANCEHAPETTQPFHHRGYRVTKCTECNLTINTHDSTD